MLPIQESFELQDTFWMKVQMDLEDGLRMNRLGEV